jgi:very-short-patch-repair endonuclease
MTVAERRGRKRDSHATEFARNQRATANEFASDAWQMLRNRNCCSEKFRREYVIEPYTVDFCCIALKLVVEIDGEHHFTDAGKSADQVRDQFLMRLGYKVLRIPGYEVLRDPQSVKNKIATAIHDIRGH